MDGEEDNNHNHHFNQAGYDPKFQALFEKVKQRELQQRNGNHHPNQKDSQQQQQQQQPGRYRWVKVAVYLWAARLGLSVFGGAIPAVFALLSWNLGFSPHKPTQAPNTALSLPTHEWMSILKDDFKIFSDFRSLQYSPQLIRNAPVISADSIQLLSHSLLKALDVKMKISTNHKFAYFTPDRPWASYLQSSYQYISIKDFLENKQQLKFRPYSFLDSLRGTESSSKTCSDNDEFQCNLDDSNSDYYMYLSFPALKPYLESFAPSLALVAKYFYPVPKDIGASLWMATENVSAIMHYDLEDNFLLQVSGTKELVIASPEAGKVIKPYSSLHPLWRQSSFADLVTYDRLIELQKQQVEDARLDAELKALQRKIEKTKQKKLLHKNHQLLSGKDDEPDLGDSDVTLKQNINMTFNAWKVTLSPGDMVFIPAGYFHAVVTGKDSVSVNAWFPSELSSIHSRLSNIPLPFYANDGLSTKVADLTIIMRQICVLLGKESDCLARAMSERYSDEIMAPFLANAACPSIAAQEYCTDNSIQLAEKKGANRRVANAAHANLQKAKLREVLQIQSVVEYIEEILLLIFNQELSPCKMEQLLRECWY